MNLTIALIVGKICYSNYVIQINVVLFKHRSRRVCNGDFLIDIPL